MPGLAPAPVDPDVKNPWGIALGPQTPLWVANQNGNKITVYRGANGVDPFSQKFDKTGHLTHGPLAENRNHGGGEFGLPDPIKQLSGKDFSGKEVKINNFIYANGDFSNTGNVGRPPTVKQGSAITFLNEDAPANLVQAPDGRGRHEATGTGAW